MKYYKTYFLDVEKTPKEKVEELEVVLREYNTLVNYPPSVMLATDLEMDAFYTRVFELEDILRPYITTEPQPVVYSETEVRTLLAMFENGAEPIKFDSEGNSMYSEDTLKPLFGLFERAMNVVVEKRTVTKNLVDRKLFGLLSRTKKIENDYVYVVLKSPSNSKKVLEKRYKITTPSR